MMKNTTTTKITNVFWLKKNENISMEEQYQQVYDIVSKAIDEAYDMGFYKGISTSLEAIKKLNRE